MGTGKNDPERHDLLSDARRDTTDLAKICLKSVFHFRKRDRSPGLQYVDTDPDRSDEYGL